jgi:paraquat-inducible protein B
MGDVPDAIVAERKRQISFVWIVPIVALVIGAWLVVKAFTEKGPTITITFSSAEGLEAGKTKIRYKDVEVGKVTTIHLSEDLSHVTVTAEMEKTAKDLLSANTRFWVVKARVAAREISGLSTLFSGAYIGLDPGVKGKSADQFTGLDEPPIVTTDLEGRQFVLQAERLGSLDIGSPLYFRQIEVGKVIGYKLDVERQIVMIRVFVDAPYDRLVRKNSRFWNVSGVNMSLDATGVRISTESLVSMALGGVAFDNPINFNTDEPATEGDIFKLYDDESLITEETYDVKRHWILRFDGSVRGLAVGAPVELRGIRLGEVLDIDVEFDEEEKAVHVNVLIETEPERIGGTGEMLTEAEFREVMNTFVARGMRAQLKTGNMITGQLYVELDFHPTAQPAVIDWSGRYPRLPTLRGNMEIITASITSLLDRMSSLPIEKIGRDFQETAKGMSSLVNSDEMQQAITDLSYTMKDARGLMAALNKDLSPAAGKANDIMEDVRQLSDHLNKKVMPAIDDTLNQARKAMTGVSGTVGPESQTVYELNRALTELAEAAKAMRGLADYLERHPDALIYGK